MSRNLLSIALTLSLFACSDNGDDANDTSTVTGSTTTSTTTTGTTSTTRSPGDKSDCTVFYSGNAITDGIFAHTLVHDSQGRVVSEEMDYDGDSTVDYVRLSTYSDNGLVIRIDFDADGIDDQLETQSFYASGTVEWASIDWENDGIEDIEFHYNEIGGVLTTIDIDGRDGAGIDGTVDEVKLFTYDGNGDVLRETLDTGNDGIDDQYLDYQRPGDFGGDYATLRDGPVGLGSELPDGTVEDWREWAHNADGQPVFTYYDEGNDGVVESMYDWLYNPDGTTASQIGVEKYGELTAFDDGFTDIRWEYSYDERGYTSEVYALVDVDSNGVADGPLDQEATDTYTWTCP